MPQNPMFDLDGRVALVTGGNGGLGLAMAAAMADAGARVVLSGRDAGKGDAAATRTGGRFRVADVTAEADCRALVADVVATEGRLDILVNNAGMTVRRRPEELTLADWDTVMTTNVTSAFMLSQAAYPALKARGGKIVNIGSMLSLFGTSFGAAYGASKGAIVQLTRSLAAAWAADGIQVNAILPGWIATDMGNAAQAQVPGLTEKVLARTPAARWGRPDDLAGIAVFLASPASDFVTGTAIPVDGGFSISG